MNVGERLKEIRRIKNLTLQDLSEKCGVSATAISAIERAVSSPTLETLGKIAAALEEPISVVIGEFEALYAAATTGEAIRLGTLLPVNKELLAALQGLGSKPSGCCFCWTQEQTDNGHTGECLAAQAAIARAEGPVA